MKLFHSFFTIAYDFIHVFGCLNVRSTSLSFLPSLLAFSISRCYYFVIQLFSNFVISLLLSDI